MTLGENLKSLRRSKGLSQDEVAQKLYVSRQTISKWELDRAEPGVENLKALAQLYGVTADQLLGYHRAEPQEEGPEQRYQKMLALRAGAVVLFLVCWAAVKVLAVSHDLEEFFYISIPGLAIGAVLLWAGMWVRNPYLWGAIICMEGLNVLIMGMLIFASTVLKLGRGPMLSGLLLAPALWMGGRVWLGYLTSREVLTLFGQYHGEGEEK